MDNEKLNKGRAIIAGKLGGAKAAPCLSGLIVSIADAFALDCGKPEESWPDYVALAVADVDSALERGAAELAQARQGLDSWRLKAGWRESALANAESEARIAKGELATSRAALAMALGQEPFGLQAKAGERTTPEGTPIRSNGAWRDLAALAIKQRDSAIESLRIQITEKEKAQGARDELQERNAALMATIGTLNNQVADTESRYRAESLRANGLESQLADARASVSELKGEAAAIDRALKVAVNSADDYLVNALKWAGEHDKSQAALARLMIALGGAALHTMPGEVLKAYVAIRDSE